MIAAHLKPKHIGKKFRTKADGHRHPLTGGLSDYVIKVNRSRVPIEVIVWINGGSAILRPDSVITPLEEAPA